MSMQRVRRGAFGVRQADKGEAVTQFLVFLVSGMELAVPLERISEIVPYERVSPLPGAPGFVRGVAHVRGRVIPVIDLAVKLARTPDPVGKRTCILMFELTLEERQVLLGIVMDNVAKLLDVQVSHIQPPPRFGAELESRVLAGLVPTERGMLPLLDVERVFAADELAHVAASSASAKAVDPGPERLRP